MKSKNLLLRLGSKLFPGSNTARGKGYHSFPGYEGPSHVGCVSDRVKMILDNFNVEEKRGVDLGCSVGGFCIELARSGANMSGIDYDPQSIDVAKHYAEKFKLNINFHVNIIDLWLIKSLKCDFIIWFSHFQWFVKQHGPGAGAAALAEISRKKIPLFFETSCGDGMAGRAMKNAGYDEKGIWRLLNRSFDFVKQIGTHKNWRNRPIFLCQ